MAAAIARSIRNLGVLLSAFTIAGGPTFRITQSRDICRLIRRALATKDELQRVAEACGQKVATVAKRASLLRKGVA